MGGSLQGGQTTLVYWTSPTGLGATSSPVVTSITANGATSTFSKISTSLIALAGDYPTDLTGTGLQIVSGALQTTLGTLVDLASEIEGILGFANGGTGQSTYATGDLLYASGIDTLSKRSVGSTGQVLSVVRRQNIWRNSRGRFSECGPRLGADVRGGSGNSDRAIGGFPA